MTERLSRGTPRSAFSLPWLLAALSCLAILAVTAVLYNRLLPSVTDVRYVRGEGESATTDLPVSFPSDGTGMQITFHVSISSVHPQSFRVLADDCIEQWMWDGREVPVSLFGECTPDRAKSIRFPPELLSSGDHTVSVRLNDPQGGRTGFDFRASDDDVLVRLFNLYCLALIACTVFCFWKATGRCSSSILAVLVLAVVLRVAYLQVTPYNVRSNDVDGHIEYVDWMHREWSIPRTGDGWEFYQPPLYYVLSGITETLGDLTLHSRYAVLRLVQYQSLLYSIVSYLLLIWISVFLYPLRHLRRSGRIFLLLILATTPVLVAMSSKINNDVLVQLLSFLAVGLLLRFWQTGKPAHWYLLMISLILGILTKLNMMLFLPVAYFCLACHHGLSWRRKITMGLLGLVIVVVSTEWFFIIKYVIGTSQFPVGNIGNLTGALLIQPTFEHIIGFHPIRFVSVPFVNSFDDASGRQFFLEYFLKSFLMGEFGFGAHLAASGRALASSLLLLIPFGLFGFIRSIISSSERRRLFPLLMLSLVFFGGHILFWIRSPYSCSADFRYSLALVIPMAFFTVNGVQHLPSILRRVGVTLLSVFVALSIHFTLLTIVYRP